MIMGKDAAILSRFPAFMRTHETGKLVGDICSVLGSRLDHCEASASDLLRSHRVNQARHEDDLCRLGALLGLSSSDFGLARTFYLSQVFGPRSKAAYTAYLDVLRTQIRRTARVFADGCGTVWALLEGTSILLAAQTLSAEDGSPALEHPDEDIWVAGQFRGGFIHRLAVRYKTLSDGAFVDRDGYIYLVENPLEEKSGELKQRYQGERFPVTKGGFFDTRPAVKIMGEKQRTVFPQVVNITTGQGIGFNGVLDDGQTLVFTRQGKAYLNGMDVTDRCYAFEGALFDEKRVVSRPGDCFVVVEPEHALHRKFPRPVVTPASQVSMPQLPLGSSTWRFSVREGVFDGDAFNRCVFRVADHPAHRSVQPCSGRVAVLWDEHALYAATILIPDDLNALDDHLAIDLAAWIRAGLDRFRGAGIRINVDYYSDEWIINHSVLRDTGALTGKGIFFDGTRI